MKPYYTDDTFTVYNSDCLSVLSELEDDSIDITFTSPPYNTGNSGKNKDMYTEYVDNLSQAEYATLLETSLSECLRVCKGAVFYNINYMNNNKNVLYKWISDFSENLRENFIWDKGPNRSTIPIGNIVMKRYEYVLMFTKDPKFEINNFRENKAIKYREQFGKWVSNLFVLPLDYDNVKFVKTHRAGFPEKLPQMFIDIYSDGGIVLDPFMGLGNCGLAARDVGRKFIGIDLVEDYCKISVDKFSNQILF